MWDPIEEVLKKPWDSYQQKKKKTWEYSKKRVGTHPHGENKSKGEENVSARRGVNFEKAGTAGKPGIKTLVRESLSPAS